MFKKCLVAGVVLAMCTNSAFAKTHTHKHNYKDEQLAVVEAPSAVVAPASTAVTYVGAGLGVRQAGSYKALLANIFAGYGKKLGQNNNYYLGGELFADAGSLSLSGRQYGNRSNFGLGASIIPGVMLTQDTMAYGRVGVKAYRTSGTNRTTTGGQLGLGVQTNVAKNWDVRGEYVYTGTGIVHNFTRHGANQVNMGLVYKLD